MGALVDAAVNHPYIGPLLQRVAASDGYAAGIVAREQLKGYVPIAGKPLTPFGVDTCGRLGRAVDELLDEMQAVAANISRLRGGSASRAIERLRERIDA